MGLNDTISAQRINIGFFGMRNAGKSSLVNAVTNQELSVVSNVKGTTTDPVKKAMELLPLGPVLIIDTPGLDDEGDLGEKRISRAKKVLVQADIAVLTVDATVGLRNDDKELITEFESRNLPYIIAYTKADLLSKREKLGKNEIYASSATKEGIDELKELLGGFAQGFEKKKHIISHMLNTNDAVILVMPIDESAPKGRVILPQQQVLRELLDAHCIAIACQPEELPQVLDRLNTKPKMVITDSQAFEFVSHNLPTDIPLTSFSILFAGYKGNLQVLVDGAKAIDNLKNGDRVLISEGCTHHRQCNDIGTVKLPKWLEEYTGAQLEYCFSSGGEFPMDLKQYALVIHCGGCMINEREMKNRINECISQGTPIVNYGVAIAHMHGILKRALTPFDNIAY
ncbi:MAG: [FeFe] hydrogenase H-cluster maturation GTPase HydF [Eubacterium sp.]